MCVHASDLHAREKINRLAFTVAPTVGRFATTLCQSPAWPTKPFPDQAYLGDQDLATAQAHFAELEQVQQWPRASSADCEAPAQFHDVLSVFEPLFLRERY